MNTNYQNTSYFSFGQQHVHRLPNITIDKNVIVKVTANDPRKVMFDTFGPEWSSQYDELPNMKYFPGGVYDLIKGRRVAM